MVNEKNSDVSPVEKGVVNKAPSVSSTTTKQAKKTISGSKSKPTTPFEVFNYCIERAENLIKIHQAAHGKKTKPEKYLADAHRAAIVLSISALDAFIRTFVIEKIREKEEEEEGQVVSKVRVEDDGYAVYESYCDPYFVSPCWGPVIFF